MGGTGQEALATKRLGLRGHRIYEFYIKHEDRQNGKVNSVPTKSPIFRYQLARLCRVLEANLFGISS